MAEHPGAPRSWWDMVRADAAGVGETPASDARAVAEWKSGVLRQVPPSQTNLLPLPVPLPSHGQVSASPDRGVPLPEGWQGLPVVWKCCKGSA